MTTTRLSENSAIDISSDGFCAISKRAGFDFNCIEFGTEESKKLYTALAEYWIQHGPKCQPKDVPHTPNLRARIWDIISLWSKQMRSNKPFACGINCCLGQRTTDLINALNDLKDSPPSVLADYLLYLTCGWRSLAEPRDGESSDASTLVTIACADDLERIVAGGIPAADHPPTPTP